MRRAISILVAGILAVAIGATVVVAARGSGRSSAHPGVVRGVIAPELEPFFNDPRVRAVLAQHGLNFEVDVQSDRRLAAVADPAHYDFAFVANAATAETVARARHATVTYPTFSTPMAIATFRPIVQTLAAAGVARESGGSWTLDLGRFVALVQRKQRWSDLPSSTYRADTPVLIRSGDVATSDAGAMYAALAGYVANSDTVLQTAHDVDAVINAVSPLFVDQGSVDQSSDAPFEDYVTLGVGRTPMAMTYEAQFVERAAARDRSITSDMVLMYPDPDVLSKRVVVPLGGRGAELGRLVAQDPFLQQIAVEHGYRPGVPGRFAAFVQAKGLQVQLAPADLIDLPTADMLESLVTRLDMARRAGQPAPVGARAIPMSITRPVPPVATPPHPRGRS